MGDTFQVGPRSRKVDPPRPRRPKSGCTLVYMGWTRNKPASPLRSPQKEKDPAEIGVQVQPGVQAWKVKT